MILIYYSIIALDYLLYGVVCLTGAFILPWVNRWITLARWAKDELDKEANT
jgi:hypothetical protein